MMITRTEPWLNVLNTEVSKNQLAFECKRICLRTKKTSPRQVDDVNRYLQCRLSVNCEGQAAAECGGVVVNRTNPRVFFDNLEFR